MCCSKYTEFGDILSNTPLIPITNPDDLVQGILRSSHCTVSLGVEDAFVKSFMCLAEARAEQLVCIESRLSGCYACTVFWNVNIK